MAEETFRMGTRNHFLMAIRNTGMNAASKAVMNRKAFALRETPLRMAPSGK